MEDGWAELDRERRQIGGQARLGLEVLAVSVAGGKQMAEI